MYTTAGHRVIGVAFLVSAIGIIGACAPPATTGSAVTNDLTVTYPLVVNNRSDFEVVVYAMSSPTTRGMRLGSARPMMTTHLKIPSWSLQTMDQFAVQLHAIGAGNSVPNWTSDGLTLNENLAAQLDIIGDRSGSLHMSSLYSRLARSIP